MLQVYFECLSGPQGPGISGKFLKLRLAVWRFQRLSGPVSLSDLRRMDGADADGGECMMCRVPNRGGARPARPLSV